MDVADELNRKIKVSNYTYQYFSIILHFDVSNSTQSQLYLLIRE